MTTAGRAVFLIGVVALATAGGFILTFGLSPGILIVATVGSVMTAGAWESSRVEGAWAD